MFQEHFQIESTYFNSAYLGPMPLRSKQSLIALIQQTLDPQKISAGFELHDAARESYAKLLGSQSTNIALSTSVSELVSHIANGIELSSKDEILLVKGEYPSMVLPWMLQAERRGIQIRFLEVADFLDPKRLEEQLSDNTKVIACSQVMFNTGTRFPIAQIGQLARQNQILFLSDISQSFGGLKLDEGTLTHVDVLVGVAYKWLLGPYGSAFGYFSPTAQKLLSRTHASWTNLPGAQSRTNLLQYTTDCLPGARKFDRGQPSSHLICTGLKASLDLLLELGLNKIEQHNQELTKYFIDQLPRRYPTLSQSQALSNIVCFQCSDPEGLRLKLAKQKIEVSLREGSLRASFHLFNTKAEVDKLLSHLE